VKAFGQTKLYKVVHGGVIVAEGARKQMHRLARTMPGAFVGMGSPASELGEQWSFATEQSRARHLMESGVAA